MNPTNPTLYIGGDLDKSKCVISAWNEKGDCLWEGEVKPTEDGFQRFLDQFPGFRYKMALEATGFIWYVVDILQDLGVDISVVNPMKNHLIGTSRKKTDLEDALKLSTGCNRIQTWQNSSVSKRSMEVIGQNTPSTSVNCYYFL